MKKLNIFQKIRHSDKTKDLVNLLYGGLTATAADIIGKMEGGKQHFVEGYIQYGPGGNSFFIKDPHWVTNTYQDVFTTTAFLMGLIYFGLRLGYHEYKMYKYNKGNQF
jgi:hypothetical protein